MAGHITNNTTISPFPGSSAFGGVADNETIVQPPPLGVPGSLLMDPVLQTTSVHAPAAHAADVAAVEHAVDYMDPSNIDFKSLPLNNLLTEINPLFHDELSTIAPDVMAGLANFHELNSTVQHHIRVPPVVVPNPCMQTAPVPAKPFFAQLQQQTVPAHPSANLTAPFVAPTTPTNRYMGPITSNPNAISPAAMLNVSTPPINANGALVSVPPMVSHPMSAHHQHELYVQNALAGASALANQYLPAMYSSPYAGVPVNRVSTANESIGSGFDPRSIRNTRSAAKMSMNDPSVLQAMASFNFKEESTIANVVPENTKTPGAEPSGSMVPNRVMAGMFEVMPVPVVQAPGTHVMAQVNGSLVPLPAHMMFPQMMAQQQLAVPSTQPQKLAAQVTPIAAGSATTRSVPQVGVGATDGRSLAADILAKEEEERKIFRAERNRYSAAASRERKKQFLIELERRVAALSKRNAQLQIEQIRAVTRRVQRERELQAANEKLKVKNFEMDMKIAGLENRLEELGVGESEYSIERRKMIGKLTRPKTYDHGVESWKAAAREAAKKEEEFNRILEEERRWKREMKEGEA